MGQSFQNFYKLLFKSGTQKSQSKSKDRPTDPLYESMKLGSETLYSTVNFDKLGGNNMSKFFKEPRLEGKEEEFFGNLVKTPEQTIRRGG